MRKAYPETIACDLQLLTGIEQMVYAMHTMNSWGLTPDWCSGLEHTSLEMTAAAPGESDP